MPTHLDYTLPITLAAILAGSAAAQPLAPPAQNTLYELMINGESFLVEGNRAVTLTSEENPDVAYQVAIRVAPTQRFRMETFQFLYDLPATVERDEQGAPNVVRLTHELGFSMIIHDLGGTLDEEARSEALKILTESVVQSFQEMDAKGIETGKPHTRKFGDNLGRGTLIRYQDEQGVDRTSLVYVLVGEQFSATCVVQYLERDKDDVLPLVKNILDSLEALPQP